MCAEYYYLIASLVSVVVLFLSLLSLQKIHKQIEISNLREYCKSYREILYKLPVEMFQERLPEDFAFSEEQVIVVCSYVGLLFEEFRLHNKRYIDSDTWKDWEENLRKHAGNPGFLKAWQSAKYFFDFNIEFTSFIEEKIHNARSPNRWRNRLADGLGTTFFTVR